ncbi:hypothetical protein CEK25_012164 [Fusarium fujikuroi]|nr:hypothetical protein CEK25_012164 [Fusarium fujikuroi]
MKAMARYIYSVAPSFDSPVAASFDVYKYLGSKPCTFYERMCTSMEDKVFILQQIWRDLIRESRSKAPWILQNLMGDSDLCCPWISYHGSVCFGSVLPESSLTSIWIMQDPESWPASRPHLTRWYCQNFVSWPQRRWTSLDETDDILPEFRMMAPKGSDDGDEATRQDIIQKCIVVRPRTGRTQRCRLVIPVS